MREWKKDVRTKYLSLVEDKEQLSREVKSSQEDLERKSEQQQTELEEKRQQQHERRMAELRERQEEHRQKLWEAKLEAELRMTQEKKEIEKSAQGTTATLSKWKITPFKGTTTDWVRFENIFLTQVHRKLITDEEKFGYLLEMVCQKVRDKISNLKPGEVGYKTAWDRLKKEYRQTKLVVNEKQTGKPVMPVCIFCKKDHWGGDCKTVVSLEARKKYFIENQLCFNCGRAGHSK